MAENSIKHSTWSTLYKLQTTEILFRLLFRMWHTVYEYQSRYYLIFTLTIPYGDILHSVQFLTLSSQSLDLSLQDFRFTSTPITALCSVEYLAIKRKKKKTKRKRKKESSISRDERGIMYSLWLMSSVNHEDTRLGIPLVGWRDVRFRGINHGRRNARDEKGEGKKERNERAAIITRRKRW